MTEHLFYWEGGGTLHKVKGDKGGLTKWGISSAANPSVDVENLTREGAMKIYQRKYLERHRIHELPDPIAAAVFDWGVNSGPKVAIRALQRELETRADGIIGPVTLHMAERSAHGITAGALCLDRLEFYFRLVERDITQRKFLKGWLRRTVATAQLCGELTKED